MKITELGIEMDVNAVHLSKQLFPMKVTELGIEMDDNEVYPEKQALQKEETNEHIIIDRKILNIY
jgi:hypothetical protein